MLSKLPRWVEYGAFTLALLAGSINAVGLLGFQHQSVSHLSGTVTLLGTGIFSSGNAVFHLLVILISFLFGSMISGFFISSASLKLGRHYGLLLFIEGLFLIFAVYFLNNHETLGHYFASGACGLQNALATTYSGAIIRTTHVTGLFTDIGIMMGSALRGEKLDKRKLILFLLIILGFLTGGSLGAWLYQTFQFMALIFPASVCFLLALFYHFYALKFVKN